jgi:hypothetical protein
MIIDHKSAEDSSLFVDRDDYVLLLEYVKLLCPFRNTVITFFFARRGNL